MNNSSDCFFLLNMSTIEQLSYDILKFFLIFSPNSVSLLILFIIRVKPSQKVYILQGFKLTQERENFQLWEAPFFIILNQYLKLLSTLPNSVLFNQIL